MCPARSSTPPSRARSGKMCPGRVSCSGRVEGSTSSRIVCALSCAEAPVVTPSRASTVTVEALGERGGIAAGHQRDRQIVEAFARHRDADQAARLPRHERDQLGADELRRGRRGRPRSRVPSSSAMMTGRPLRNSSIASGTETISPSCSCWLPPVEVMAAPRSASDSSLSRAGLRAPAPSHRSWSQSTWPLNSGGLLADPGRRFRHRLGDLELQWIAEVATGVEVAGRLQAAHRREHVAGDAGAVELQIARQLLVEAV